MDVTALVSSFREFVVLHPETKKVASARNVVPDLEVLVRVHLPAKAERSHICPHLFDVIQAFLLRALPTHIPPIQRVLPICGPN
jgi:hypothetical protein